MKLLSIRVPSLRLLSLVLVIGLASCSTNQSSKSTKDSGPKGNVDVSHVNDAVPGPVKRTRAGNKNPYRVLGKTYHLMADSKGYRETGPASWYGRKFHGRNTANGEVYDMYKMTAAHKTLPIPSYVRVTNVNNKRSVVVRVNDRGPFHGNRIIDLSYAAAKKLDFANQGVATVLVEDITPDKQAGNAPPKPVTSAQLAPEPVSVSSAQPVAVSTLAVTQAAPVTELTPQQREARKQAVKKRALEAAVMARPSSLIDRNTTSEKLVRPKTAFLQVGAFREQAGAHALADKVKSLVVYPVTASLEDAFYRVKVGPIKPDDVPTVEQQLNSAGVDYRLVRR